MDWEIREAKPQDTAEMLDLFRMMLRLNAELGAPIKPSDENLRHFEVYLDLVLRSEMRGTALVAQSPVGEVVGALLWVELPLEDTTIWGLTARALGTALREGWRGQGLGSALRQQAFKSLKAQGFKAVVASAFRCNQAGVVSLESAGFVPFLYSYYRDLDLVR